MTGLHQKHFRCLTTHWPYIPLSLPSSRLSILCCSGCSSGSRASGCGHSSRYCTGLQGSWSQTTGVNTALQVSTPLLPAIKQLRSHLVSQSPASPSLPTLVSHEGFSLTEMLSLNPNLPHILQWLPSMYKVSPGSQRPCDLALPTSQAACLPRCSPHTSLAIPLPSKAGPGTPPAGTTPPALSSQPSPLFSHDWFHGRSLRAETKFSSSPRAS